MSVHDESACAGEACVIPAGFKGVFEVLETVMKHYVFVKRGEMR